MMMTLMNHTNNNHPNNQPELEYALHVGLEATNECVINFH